MKTSRFRIVPIRTEIVEAARREAGAGAPDHVFLTADSPKGYPCRHCLRWAKPGERMILFPFAAIAPGRPYSESGPIFVHAEPCDRYAATREFPVKFRKGRVLRAYNSQHDIIAAEVANGEGPEDVIERFLQEPETAFVHVRSASHGCYTMEIVRV
jgi:Protein of unknown function (DUF1203)